MAITVERMVAVLEARVDQFEKSIAGARDKSTGDFAAITAAGNKMETSIGRLGANGRKGFDSLSKSVNSLKGQTGNLAAQFNDIGVQLAGGQNPFLIAIQQGSQINQVLGQAGAKGAVSALGGALVSLLNPVSLATIALIGLGGTAIQYFTSMLSEGDDANKKLEDHAGLIKRVADRWGEAVPGLKAYADELERAKEIADLRAAGDVKIKEDIQSINNAFDEFIAANSDAVDAIERSNNVAGAASTTLTEFADQWERLSPKVRDGTATQEDFSSATKALRLAVADSGGDLDEFGTQFETIAGRIGNALLVLQSFQDRMKAALVTGIQVQADIQRMTTGQINNPNLPDPNFRLPDEGPTPTRRPLIELEGNERTASAAKKQSDAFASATQSLRERTEALQAQYEAQSKLNPLVNDYGYAVEYAKARQDLLTAAQKAGKEVTPQLAAEVDKIAGAYARTTAELAKLADENKKAAEAVQFQKDLVNGALSDMRTALEDGKLSWKDLGNVAVNVLNKIADKLQQMLVDQLFAKGFGGLFGSLLGIGGAVGGVAGSSGAAAVASAASVSPSATMRAMKLPSAGQIAKAQAVDVVVSVDDEGSLRAYVQKEGRRTEARVAAGTQMTFDNYRRNQLHNDINSHVRSPRRRGSI